MPVIHAVRKVLITSLALNAALSSYAQADEPSADDTSIWGDETLVTLGLMAAYTPRYQGSKNYTSDAAPVLHIERGIFFLDSDDGLGLQWRTDAGFSARASIGYDLGRADGDSDSRYGSDKLKGMGEVGGATVLNLHAAQQLTSWLALDTHAQFRLGGAKRGDQYALGLEATLLHDDHDNVAWRVDAHAGNGRFNQTYYGVTDQQSVNSRFDSFKADNGIYAYSTELSWLHRFDEHWTTIAGIELTHYTDQVRKSPVVTADTTASSFIGVNYSF
ncbi:MipA/OmpV family protein [Pseudomonas sp. NPDC089422]|uniref:MipA/OmpV family protein n=1 Tax=Pseudomonas sp. NPDC089422 TaxID=3364466 RepID=UPI0038059CB7